MPQERKGWICFLCVCENRREESWERGRNKDWNVWPLSSSTSPGLCHAGPVGDTNRGGSTKLWPTILCPANAPI